MENLTGSEVDKLLESINILNSSVEPQTLPKRTVKAVSHLLENDGISFDVFSSQGKPISTANWHEPVGFFTEELFEAFSENISEHMFFEQLIKREAGIYRNTDALSMEEFAKTNLFNEFYKKCDITHQLHTILSVNDEMTLACSMSRKNFDFSDKEKQMLEIFSPHLSNAVKNANAFEQILVEKSTNETVLEKAKIGAIIFDEYGKVLQKTGLVEELISKYFNKRKTDKNGVPDTLLRLVNKPKFRSKNKGRRTPLQSRIIETNEGILGVKVIVENRKRQKTLLFEEKSEISLKQIVSLGVTRRESEVLLWLGKGKTNPEIAILLDIKPRTVQKHTENIYRKLGVETRTAAALRVNELH